MKMYKQVFFNVLILLCLFTFNVAVMADTITYYHNDISGSPLLATDANGNLLWKENHQPYGEKLNQQQASASNSIGFHGKPYDYNTGLSYMGARNYAPLVGRFTGVDPVDFQEDNLHSFNRYAYANNNPYKYVDPDGKFGVIVGWAAFAVLALKSADIGLTANDVFQGYQSGGVPGAGKELAIAGVLNMIPGGKLLDKAHDAFNALKRLPNSAAEDGLHTAFSEGEKMTKRSGPELIVKSTQTQAINALTDNGYTKNVSKSGVATEMTKGDKVFRFYPESTGRGSPGPSTGLPSASIHIEGKTVLKLRFEDGL